MKINADNFWDIEAIAMIILGFIYSMIFLSIDRYLYSLIALFGSLIVALLFFIGNRMPPLGYWVKQ